MPTFRYRPPRTPPATSGPRGPTSWDLHPGDPPPERFLQRFPELRDLPDNAVFRLLMSRRRPIPRDLRFAEIAALLVAVALAAFARESFPGDGLDAVFLSAIAGGWIAYSTTAVGISAVAFWSLGRQIHRDLALAAYPPRDAAVALWGVSVCERSLRTQRRRMAIAAGLVASAYLAHPVGGEGHFVLHIAAFALGGWFAGLGEPEAELGALHSIARFHRYSAREHGASDRASLGCAWSYTLFLFVIMLLGVMSIGAAGVWACESISRGHPGREVLAGAMAVAGSCASGAVFGWMRARSARRHRRRHLRGLREAIRGAMEFASGTPSPRFARLWSPAPPKGMTLSNALVDRLAIMEIPSMLRLARFAAGGALAFVPLVALTYYPDGAAGAASWIVNAAPWGLTSLDDYQSLATVIEINHHYHLRFALPIVLAAMAGVAFSRTRRTAIVLLSLAVLALAIWLEVSRPSEGEWLGRSAWEFGPGAAVDFGSRVGRFASPLEPSIRKALKWLVPTIVGLLACGRKLRLWRFALGYAIAATLLVRFFHFPPPGVEEPTLGDVDRFYPLGRPTPGYYAFEAALGFVVSAIWLAVVAAGRSRHTFFRSRNRAPARASAAERTFLRISRPLAILSAAGLAPLAGYFVAYGHWERIAVARTFGYGESLRAMPRNPGEKNGWTILSPYPDLALSADWQEFQWFELEGRPRPEYVAEVVDLAGEDTLDAFLAVKGSRLLEILDTRNADYVNAPPGRPEAAEPYQGRGLSLGARGLLSTRAQFAMHRGDQAAALADIRALFDLARVWTASDQTWIHMVGFNLGAAAIDCVSSYRLRHRDDAESLRAGRALLMEFSDWRAALSDFSDAAKHWEVFQPICIGGYNSAQAAKVEIRERLLAAKLYDFEALEHALDLHEIERGRRADSLDLLVPGYFASLPSDPATGEPYRYDPERAFLEEALGAPEDRDPAAFRPFDDPVAGPHAYFDLKVERRLAAAKRARAMEGGKNPGASEFDGEDEANSPDQSSL